MKVKAPGQQTARQYAVLDVKKLPANADFSEDLRKTLCLNKHGVLIKDGDEYKACISIRALGRSKVRWSASASSCRQSVEWRECISINSDQLPGMTRCRCSQCGQCC